MVEQIPVKDKVRGSSPLGGADIFWYSFLFCYNCLMSWKQATQEGQEIILATSSKENTPHAIIVISLGLLNDKLLIGACLTKTSLENIKNNNRVSLVAKYKNEYYRIDGWAKIYCTGKYLDITYKKSKPPMPKAAILIDIREVFDLDKQKKIIWFHILILRK